MQLANVTRSEPDASLFTIPSNYTVTKGPGPGGPGPHTYLGPPTGQ